jgi:hypothetical protein
LIAAGDNAGSVTQHPDATSQPEGPTMKKLPVYFAPVFAVVAGTATVLTVVTPQSAIADGCSGGNC